MKRRPAPFDREWSPLPQQAVRFMKQEARLSDPVCWLYAVLIARTDGKTSEVTDSSEALCHWSGCGDERTLRRRLHSLACHGLIEREAIRARGGPKGSAWRWTTRFLPPDRWTVEPRCATCKKEKRQREEQGTVRPLLSHEEQGKVGPALRGRTAHRRAGHQRVEEEVSSESKNRVPPRSITPDVSQSPSQKGAAAPLSMTDEGFERNVVACWRAARTKPGLERFTDPAAIKNLKTAATRAETQGSTLADVARGIAMHAHEPNANPWYVDEWAREARAERDERDQLERRIKQREEEDARLAEEREALRQQYPGLALSEIYRLKAASA